MFNLIFNDMIALLRIVLIAFFILLVFMFGYYVGKNKKDDENKRLNS